MVLLEGPGVAVGEDGEDRPDLAREHPDLVLVGFQLVGQLDHALLPVADFLSRGGVGDGLLEPADVGQLPAVAVGIAEAHAEELSTHLRVIEHQLAGVLALAVDDLEGIAILPLRNSVGNHALVREVELHVQDAVGFLEVVGNDFLCHDDLLDRKAFANCEGRFAPSLVDDAVGISLQQHIIHLLRRNVKMKYKKEAIISLFSQNFIEKSRVLPQSLALLLREG